MNIKSTDPTRSARSVPGFDLGPERTEAMLNLQKDLLGTYEEASRAWLARVQSEVDLWSGLAARLTATRSVPRSGGGLPGMRGAADENGGGGRTTTGG